MSKYDTTAVKVFDNEVLENVIENQIITALDFAQFATADNSLVENAGMTKRIRTYIGNGSGQTLAMGVGNSQVLGTSFVDNTYEVLTYQARYDYYDEQAMDDPIAIDSLAQRMATDFVNKVTNDVSGELAKGTNKRYGQTWGYDCVADAQSAFPHENPTTDMLFLLIARADLGTWKKALKGTLQYVEAFARTGYIGTVDGVSIYYTDGVPTGKAFLASKKAVTMFTKRGFHIESERDANTRKNSVFGRKVQLTALTNDDQVIVLLASADPRSGKTLQESKPADWDSKYATDYYFYDAAAGTCNLNTESDWDKVAGYIYK